MGDPRWRRALVALVLVIVAGSCAEPEQTVETSAGLPYRTPNGQVVELLDAPDAGVRLIDWAFDRFDAAGIGEPVVSSITFGGGESQGCLKFAGLVQRGVDGALVMVCLPEDRICMAYDPTEFRAPAKLCVLHELAHAWLFTHADTQTEEVFMAIAGVDNWASAEASWHERGVEHAADTLAWGLMDKPLRMIRIGEPSCQELTEGFRILTGAGPLIVCGVS